MMGLEKAVLYKGVRICLKRVVGVGKWRLGLVELKLPRRVRLDVLTLRYWIGLLLTV